MSIGSSMFLTSSTCRQIIFIKPHYLYRKKDKLSTGVKNLTTEERNEQTKMLTYKQKNIIQQICGQKMDSKEKERILMIF